MAGSQGKIQGVPLLLFPKVSSTERQDFKMLSEKSGLLWSKGRAGVTACMSAVEPPRCREGKKGPCFADRKCLS